MKLSLTLCFFLGTLSAFAFDFESSMVSVSSTYFDRADGKKVLIQGQGSLLEYQNRYFILTASHVSQGENPQIMFGDQKFEIFHRGADVFADVEILEVAPTGVKPLATWNKESGFFEVAPQSGWPAWHLIEGNRRNAYDAKNPGLLQLDWTSVLLVPKRLWSQDELSQINRSFYDRFFLNGNVSLESTQRLWWTASLLEKSSSLKLKPGTSGSPILSMLQLAHSPMQLAITGIAIRSQRSSEFSHFAPAKAIKDVFVSLLSVPKKHDAEIRHNLNGARWYLHSGLLYREDKVEEWSEALPLFNLQASGTNAPTGNGTSADGGNGTSADGGNGTSIDGGATLNSPPQLSAEMRYKGQNVIAFELQEKPSGRPVIVNASFSSYKMIREFKGRFNIRGLSSDDFGLVDLIRMRLKGQGVTLKDAGLNASVSLKFIGEEIIVSLPEGDELLLKNEKHFSALRLTKMGNVADVTELYSLDPSYIRIPFLDESRIDRESPLAIVASQLKKNALQICIRVRDHQAKALEVGHERIFCSAE